MNVSSAILHMTTNYGQNRCKTQSTLIYVVVASPVVVANFDTFAIFCVYWFFVIWKTVECLLSRKIKYLRYYFIATDWEFDRNFNLRNLRQLVVWQYRFCHNLLYPNYRANALFERITFNPQTFVQWRCFSKYTYLYECLIYMLLALLKMRSLDLVAGK